MNLYGEISQKAVGSKSTKTSHLVHEISTVMYDKSRNKNTASSCGVRDERSTIGHESTSTIHHRWLHESCSLKTETVWRKVENGTATKCQPRSVLSLKRTSGNSLQMSPQLPVAPSWWRNVQCLMGKDSGWAIWQSVSTSWSGNIQILYRVRDWPLNIEDAKYHSKNRNFLLKARSLTNLWLHLHEILLCSLNYTTFFVNF